MGFIYDFRDGRDRYHLELMHARSSRTSCPRHPPRCGHVRAQLTRKDVVALALPGFDNPAPARFTSTKEAYADGITATGDHGHASRSGRPESRLISSCGVTYRGARRVSVYRERC